jgi:16S rRNA (guanine1516-N2)-methyltransferase
MKQLNDYVDFTIGSLDYRRRNGGGRKQALAKAIGLKKAANPTVVDATAGLGRDAFILASLGCKVHMLERSPVVAALLSESLEHAKNNTDIAPIIERLKLTHEDAKNYLYKLCLIENIDVIYLDPMYPHRKKSALVKQEMRLLRTIVGEDVDAAALLQAALESRCKRIVVKRPKVATHLNDHKPSFCIESKNTRYDVYLKQYNV